MEELSVAAATQDIFRETVTLMQHIQFVHLPPGTGTITGANAAAQLLFTINCNHVLKAMPGLPQNRATRHRLIATLIAQTLKF